MHPESKTVAEGDLFDREFDAIADIYEKRLEGRGQRWCTATRLLRLSYAASEAGDKKEGARWRRILKASCKDRFGAACAS